MKNILIVYYLLIVEIKLILYLILNLNFILIINLSHLQ